MKKKNIIISFFLIILLISTYAYATVDSDIIVKLNKASTTVKRGEEVQVDLYLDNFEYEGKGVDEFVIKLDINEAIIEPISVNNIITKNGIITIGDNNLVVEDVKNATEDQVVFSDLTTDCDYKIFIDLKKPYTIENYENDAKIISIKYKVKEDAALGDVENAVKYSVDLSQQVTAEDLKNGFSSYKVSAINDIVFLTVEENKATDNENTNTDDNTNTDNNNTNKDDNTNTDNNNTNTNQDNNNIVKDNNNTNQNNDNTNNNTTNKDNTITGDDNTTNNNGNNSLVGASNAVLNSIKGNSTTATSALPAAGLKRFVLPVIILAGLAIFSYKKYDKYRDIK